MILQDGVVSEEAVKNIKMALFAFTATALLMTVYQLGKFYLLRGEYSIWQSHIMTIVFTSLIATIVALSMTNWLERLNRLRSICRSIE